MAKIRCVICDAEFTEAEIDGCECCPKCGSANTPLSTDKDRTIRINEHELRILTIWAANWSSKCPAESQKCLNAIIQRLREQLPGVPLTLTDEIQELQDHGYKARLVDVVTGEVLVPDKDEPS